MKNDERKSTTTYTARHTISRNEEEEVGADFNFSQRKRQFGVCSKTTTQAVSVCSWPSKSTTTTEVDEKSFEEIELERRRKRDREAARVAVSRIKRSADIDVNLDAEKELVSLSSCSCYDVLAGNPLRRLGLFLKREYNDDQEGKEEEGIFFGDDHVGCTKKPYIDMGGYKVDNINGVETIPTLSCGYAMSLPRKADDHRAEMLKLRYKDIILKAQKALGITSDDHNNQEKRRKSLKKTTSSTRHYCKSKAATINAPIRGAAFGSS